MKPECERYRQELTALRRGEEAEIPAAELGAHLEACEECRGARQQGDRLFALLDELQPAPAGNGPERLRLAISTGKYRSGPAAGARRWRISLPAAVFAAAAAFLAALWLGAEIDWDGPTPPKLVAVLTSMQGAESPDGKALRPGDVLTAGTRLRLGPDGRARLVLHRGAEVELAGGSVVELLAEDRLRLEKGKLLAVVRKGGTPFTVSTPQAEVTTLGTRFVVDAGQGATHLAVIEGRVRFTHTGPGDGSVEVGGRQASTVLAGSAPSRPAPASLDDLAWTLSGRRPQLKLELVPARDAIRPGERLSVRLRLVNHAKTGLSVDGTGRGRSSYFVRVEDPAGQRSHFSPTVLSARVDGMRTKAPVVRLNAGGAYELELNLGRFAKRPGEYLLTAIYLESAASASTDWSGALVSGTCKITVKAPPPAKAGAKSKESKNRTGHERKR